MAANTSSRSRRTPDGLCAGRLELTLDGASADPDAGIDLAEGRHRVRAVLRPAAKAAASLRPSWCNTEFPPGNLWELFRPRRFFSIAVSYFGQFGDLMSSIDSTSPDAWFRLDKGLLEIGGDWTIGASARLDQGLRALKTDQDVRIDASKLEKLDSSGAWLLLRTRRALEGAGRKVEGPELPGKLPPPARPAAAMPARGGAGAAPP